MNERILELIKKLLAHEQSARAIGSTAEADAFAEKIQSLCDAYRIGLADLNAEQVAETIAEIRWLWRDGGFATDKRNAEKWMKLLAAGIAYGHECKQVRLAIPGGSVGFSFVGVRADAEVCAAMFSVLLQSGLTAWRNVTDRRFKRSSFLWGFALAIGNRYHERRAAAVQNSDAAQALVRTIDLAINEYFKHPRFRPGAKVAPPRQNRSMVEGFKAGQAVSLESKTLKSAALRLKA